MASDGSAFPCRGKGSFFKAAEHLHFHGFYRTENVLGEDRVSIFKNMTWRLDVFVNTSIQATSLKRKKTHGLQSHLLKHPNFPFF